MRICRRVMVISPGDLTASLNRLVTIGDRTFARHRAAGWREIGTMAAGGRSYAALLLVFLGLIHNSISVGVMSPRNRLWRDLMANYNRNIMPKIDSHEKMIILAVFNLKKVESLQEQEQAMTSFGWVALRWMDDLLVWDPRDYNDTQRLTVSSEEIWIPELSLYNSLDAGSDLSLDNNFRANIFADGTVFWAPGFKWRTACNINLQYFPFDTQTCSVQFVNWMYGVDLLDYIVDEVQITNYEPNDAWNLVNRSAGHDLYYGDDGNMISVPLMYFNLTMSRKPTYYILNVLVPCLTISSLSLLVFLLPSEAGEKMSLAITVFLAYTVLLLMISDITPKSGATMPLLTLMIVMNMMQTGISLLLTVVILRVFHSSGRRPVPGWVRRVVLDCLATILCMCSSRDARRRKVAGSDNTKPTSTHVGGSYRISPLNVRDLDEDEIMQTPEANKIQSGRHLTVMGQSQETANQRDVITLPEDVIDMARHLADKEKTAEAEEKNRCEWQTVSRVLDRLFFFSYVVLTTLEVGWYVVVIMYN